MKKEILSWLVKEHMKVIYGKLYSVVSNSRRRSGWRCLPGCKRFLLILLQGVSEKLNLLSFEILQEMIRFESI